MHIKERQRVFLAFPLVRSIRQGISHFRNENLHFQQSGFRWIPDANLHMTIFYLGPVLLRDIGSITEQIQAVLTVKKYVEFIFQGFSLQPSRKPRMIWAQYFLNQDFTDLVHHVSDVCQPYLLERSKHHARPIPHVTIARIKKFDSPINLKANILLPNFRAQQAELWLSASEVKGVVYTPLASFSFSKIEH